MIKLRKLERKLESFIATLSDNEIEDQIENILEWTKVYKNLLQEEQMRRRYTWEQRSYCNGDEGCIPRFDDGLKKDECFVGINPSGDIDFEEMNPSEDIDYYVAQRILRKVELMSAEETKGRICKLKVIPEMYLSDEMKAQLHFELDSCELHLYELTGIIEDEAVCPGCGNPLESCAKFCRKCGRRI